MPVVKVTGGWKVQGGNKVFKTEKEAMDQLRAIKASQARKKKERAKNARSQ